MLILKLGKKIASIAMIAFPVTLGRYDCQSNQLEPVVMTDGWTGFEERRKELSNWTGESFQKVSDNVSSQ
jgi:hypothetical protein